MSSKLNIYACSGVDTVNSRDVANKIENSGWYRNEVLRKYLGSSKEGGCAEYFLYIFIPENELSKYNAVIYRKRKQQLKTYEYVRELFVSHNYGTEQDLLAIIRRGIEHTFNSSVESILMTIRQGKGEGIGPITEAVASIIVAVITAVVAIISGIIQYAQSVKVAKYTAPTMQEIENSAPASSDFTNKAKKRGFFWLAVGGVAYWLLQKK